MTFAHCATCHVLYLNTPADFRVCKCGAMCKVEFAAFIGDDSKCFFSLQDVGPHVEMASQKGKP